MVSKSRRAGLADAQSSLGYMYDKGQGVAKNYAQAEYWYGKAAEQGYAKAQNNLTGIHEKDQPPEMKKIITINKNIVNSLVIGLLLGAITVFVVDNWSKFSYIPNGEGIIISLFLKTPFGTNLTFPDSGLTARDLWLGKYSKIKYYLRAWVADLKYVLIIGFIFAVVLYLLLNYKIKLK